MKYIIELPDEFAEATKEYWDKTVGLQLEPYLGSDRERIEEEVWGFLAFLIDEMDLEDKCECFGVSSAYKIATNMSYNEAKDKYDEWLKQKDEVKVGDEVILTLTQYDRMIVTRTWNDDYLNDCVDTIGFDGSTYSFLKSKVKKTGRHFPEVGQMLEKIKG